MTALFGLTDLLFPIEIQAASNLSITPHEGGASLRFGRIDNPSTANQEVRIRVNSDESQQYQIFQRLINPLSNETGASLHPEAFKTYTIPGSNGSGTMYQQDPVPLGFADELLYTSSPDGHSDSFTVVYQVDPDRIDNAGSFLGKIMYTLRPIGAGPQQDVFLDVSLETEQETREPDIAFSSGNGTIRLNTSREKIPETVKFSFVGNRGEVRVYQEIEQFPEDQFKDLLNRDLVQFQTNSASSIQSQFPLPTSFEKGRQLIFSSREPSSTLTVNFLVNQEELVKQKAGQFFGKVKYDIEEGEQSRAVPVDLEVEVAPIFKLDVEYPPEGVRFSNLLPGAPPQTKVVTVKVLSNLGKPYMITQNVNAALTNAKGEKISPDFFNMKTELLDNEVGKVEFPQFGSVSTGAVPIFFSNSKGFSTRFRVFYQLRPYPEMLAGDYNASFIYSLNEM